MKYAHYSKTLHEVECDLQQAYSAGHYAAAEMYAVEVSPGVIQVVHRPTNNRVTLCGGGPNVLEAVSQLNRQRSCRDCVDCDHCTNCLRCTNCIFCTYCTDCSDSTSSDMCLRCRGLQDCRRCHDCVDMRFSENCTNCRHMYSCLHCTNCEACTNCKSSVACTFCYLCAGCTSCIESIGLKFKARHFRNRTATDKRAPLFKFSVLPSVVDAIHRRFEEFKLRPGELCPLAESVAYTFMTYPLPNELLASRTHSAVRMQIQLILLRDIGLSVPYELVSDPQEADVVWRQLLFLKDKNLIAQYATPSAEEELDRFGMTAHPGHHRFTFS